MLADMKYINEMTDPSLLNFKNRNIAITDLETTGLDVDKHEIIEIGLVLVSQPDLEIIETWETKVKPINPETANKDATKINGYTPLGWSDAMELKEALIIYTQKTKEAIFCAYNVLFDYTFLRKAFKETKITNTMDYHGIDIPSLVWEKLRKTKHSRIKLSLTAEYLGLSKEPDVHQAINGAMSAYQVLKKLVEM